MNLFIIYYLLLNYKIINKKDAKYDVEVAYELDAASDKIAMPIEDDD